VNLEPDYRIEKLSTKHKRNEFTCGIHPLDVYFRQYIQQDIRKKICAAFVLLDDQTHSVIGYYTLSATGIPAHDFPESEIIKLPKYPILPATLLGRLAVDFHHQGKGYGEILLMNALYKSLQYSTEIGSLAVVVNVINEKASTFYESYGFIPFKDAPKKLFITMKKIKNLFSNSD